MPEAILEVDPQVHLRADRDTAREGGAPETFREDHPRMAERLGRTSGPLRLDGARPRQQSRKEYHSLVRPSSNLSLPIGRLISDLLSFVSMWLEFVHTGQKEDKDKFEVLTFPPSLPP